MHAGASESLLTGLKADRTPDVSKPTQTSRAFARAIGKTLTNLGSNRPLELVLLGDVLDLSLAKPWESAQCLRDFLTELFEHLPNRPDTIRFLPGNHDHQVWTAERLACAARDPANPEAWQHTRPAFAQGHALHETSVLQAVLPKDAPNVVVHYPNYGVTNGDRTLVLHHGHFVEGTYRAMSSLLDMLQDGQGRPAGAEDLESENGIWIDFLWSTLGGAGRFDDTIPLYRRFLTTGGAAHALQRRLGKMMSKALREELSIPRSTAITEAFDNACMALVDAKLGSFSEFERFGYLSALSSEGIEGLKRYLSDIVGPEIDDAGARRDDVAFVFGHTHKPFQDRLVVPGYPRPVNVFNTGGWNIDSTLRVTAEGADVVLWDENLMPVSLHMYSTGNTTIPFSNSDITSVVQTNPFHGDVAKAALAAADEWNALRAAADGDLDDKQDMYLTQAEDADVALAVSKGMK